MPAAAPIASSDSPDAPLDARLDRMGVIIVSDGRPPRGCRGHPSPCAALRKRDGADCGQLSFLALISSLLKLALAARYFVT